MKKLLAAIAVLGFVTNFSVHSFATSGLATMLQTALVLGAFHAVQLARSDESAGTRPLAAASLCAALALLVRLEVVAADGQRPDRVREDCRPAHRFELVALDPDRLARAHQHPLKGTD